MEWGVSLEPFWLPRGKDSLSVGADICFFRLPNQGDELRPRPFFATIKAFQLTSFYAPRASRAEGLWRNQNETGR